MRARKCYLSPLCLLSSQRVDERLREAVEVSGECWSMEHRGGKVDCQRSQPVLRSRGLTVRELGNSGVWLLLLFLESL